MIQRIRNFYRHLFAGIMLFTVEMVLSVALFLLAFVVFVFIAKYVFLDNKQAFDQAAFNFVGTMVSDRSTAIILFLTDLGNSTFLLTANLLLTAYFLFVRKHKWYSIKIPSIALSSVMVMFLLKEIFNRSRPLIPLLEPARGLSFPSGHAMSSVTFFGLLIWFIWRENMNRYLKLSLIFLLILLILLIGLSRVYLRVHYASDVIGGFCTGIIWLTISIWIIRKIEFYSKRELTKVVDKVPPAVKS